MYTEIVKAGFKNTNMEQESLKVNNKLQTTRCCL